MNYLDIIVLLPLLWGVYKGFNRGLVVEVASLAALVLGVWCAIRFSAFTAEFLINTLHFDISENYLSPISFAVTFIAVALCIVVVSRMIDKLLSAIALGGINKLLGAFFGGAKLFLIMAILLFFINSIDKKVGFIDEEKKNESLFYKPLIGLIENSLPQLDVDEMKKKVPKVNVLTDSNIKI